MERLSLEGHAQSSFHYSIRRTQCDQQPMIRRKQLDFVSTRSDTKVFASQSAGDVRLRPPQDSDFQRGLHVLVRHTRSRSPVPGVAEMEP